VCRDLLTSHFSSYFWDRIFRRCGQQPEDSHLRCDKGLQQKPPSFGFLCAATHPGRGILLIFANAAEGLLTRSIAESSVILTFSMVASGAWCSIFLAVLSGGIG
jgi:hypothetical protein